MKQINEKMKQKENKKTSEYIFDEWEVNPYLLIPSLILFGINLFLAKDVLLMFLMGLSYLLLGWGIAFSKRKIK
jgi:hypothetical protein